MIEIVSESPIGKPMAVHKFVPGRNIWASERPLPGVRDNAAVQKIEEM